jgi:hypothetical protein
MDSKQRFWPASDLERSKDRQGHLFYEVIGHADLNVAMNGIPCFSLADEHPQVRSHSVAADTNACQFLRATVQSEYPFPKAFSHLAYSS